MAQGGVREGAGRKAGSIGRKTMEAISIFKELGYDPLSELAKIGLGQPFPNGELPTSDQMLNAHKEGCQYVYPKRKAVEHSGNIGTHEENLQALDESEDDD